MQSLTLLESSLQNGNGEVKDDDLEAVPPVAFELTLLAPPTFHITQTR